MLKYLRLFLVVGIISACTTTPQSVLDGDRLPDPVSAEDEVLILIQWEEYCARVEWEDPACETVE